MATKTQVIAALTAKCINATLYDESCSDSYTVQIEAPEGCHWQGSEHCRVIVSCNDGDKSSFWDEVIGEIVLLQDAVKCIDEHCEGVLLHGECEYWNN